MRVKLLPADIQPIPHILQLVYIDNPHPRTHALHAGTCLAVPLCKAPVSICILCRQRLHCRRKIVVRFLRLVPFRIVKIILKCTAALIQAVTLIRIRRMGKSGGWILRHHLLPHLAPQFLTGLILMFPHAILHEASISFLGYGLPPEQPAVGIILAESMTYLSSGMWWMAVFPGMVLVLMVWLIDRLGENLRRVIDPYSAQE